jgi:hypothetical protein
MFFNIIQFKFIVLEFELKNFKGKFEFLKMSPKKNPLENFEINKNPSKVLKTPT